MFKDVMVKMSLHNTQHVSSYVDKGMCIYVKSPLPPLQPFTWKRWLWIKYKLYFVLCSLNN